MALNPIEARLNTKPTATDICKLSITAIVRGLSENWARLIRKMQGDGCRYGQM